MNEPKKLGRPSKADIAARQAPAVNGDTSREPEDVLERVEPAVPDEAKLAQAYAMRVWKGQSVDVGRGVKVARCKAAVEGQGLPTDALIFPEA